MNTPRTLFEGAQAAHAPGPRSFAYLLSAYFLPRDLFLDPEAQGSWGRWERRRYNLDVLRRYSLVFARRWAGVWLLGSLPGSLLGGTAGSLLMLLAGLGIVPMMIFACAKLAADIAGDDLPL